MTYQTILMRLEAGVCYLRLNRATADNAINSQLVDECMHALAACQQQAHIVVLEGLPQVFCVGADFKELTTAQATAPESLYTLWEQLSRGPFISIAHVRGRANAGGVGMAAACDIVLAGQSAEFSLSEMLFSLFPACVLPFLIRRIGFQRANYMTLSTRPVSSAQALEWGLADAVEEDSEALLRKHLLRLRRLSKAGITRYKNHLNSLDTSLLQARPAAIAANRDMFSDSATLEKIDRYARTGQFPWEN